LSALGLLVLLATTCVVVAPLTASAATTAPAGVTVTSSSQGLWRTTASISLVKTASISSFSAAGTPVTYSYLVTNTGSVTLSNVTVTDPMVGLSSVVCPSATLAASASETCTATYTTTAADVTAGSISNTGTVTASPPSGPCVSATSSLTIPYKTTTAIGLVKTASVASFSASGTLVTYYYQVTNTGSTTLTSVGVTDPMTGLSAIVCPSSTLAAGATEQCTATYTTTAADVTAGSISNTGTATGTHCSTTVTATSTLTIPYSAVVSPTSSIALVKSASISGFSSAGTLVTYYYLVTNTGTVSLSHVKVTDPMTGLSAIVCPSSTLAAGASETCTATYTTTAADVTAGSISNTGTVTASPPSGPCVSATSSLTIPATSGGAIGLVKTASIASFSASGTLVTYYYQVTNTGSTTLTSVGVTDPMTDLSAIVCPSSTLAAGATEQCTATYTTTAADVTAGSISNTGTATGTPPSGPPVTSTSSVTIPYSTVTPPSSSISLVKTVSIASFSASGTLVTYYYQVTNTGSTTLTSVGVTDPMTDLSAIVCPSSTLAAGATEQCTATYTTTAADVTAGSISNTGTATGTPPSGPPVTSTSSVTIPYSTVTPPSSSIDLVKTASIASFSASGTLVTYYYQVTNTGSTTLTSVGVTDPMTGLSAIVCPSSTLAAGASEQCTATYTTTAANVTAGSISNTGTATGTPPSGPSVTSTSSVTIPYVPTVTIPSSPPPAPATASPAISLSKTAGTSTYDAVGQVVTYTYVITNTGNVSLPSAQYTVTDNTISGGVAFDCGAPQVLAVGATITCTHTYTITSGNLSSGSVTNLATATNGTQTSPVATATITATATIKTKIPVSPPKHSHHKIPIGPPETGAGGAARTGNAGLLAAGGALVLAGLGAIAFLSRRRRA
jgi:uncharacterized repeat protein (TIGR01451 family)